MLPTVTPTYLILFSTNFLSVLSGHQASLGEHEDPNKWSLTLSNDWNVLGPISQAAREQHFISPMYPIDLTNEWPLDYGREYGSSLTDGATIRWSNTTSNDGKIEVSFPEVRWQQLRLSEGWAALQHHALLHSELTVVPPLRRGKDVAVIPLLVADVRQVSFLTIIPENLPENYTPKWHNGNIYGLPNSPTQLIPLPFPPSDSQPTKYHVFASGDYEIRLFGDPLDMGGQETPIQRLIFKLSVADSSPAVQLEPQLDVTPDFIGGWALSHKGAMGIGLKNSDYSWWEVTAASFLTSGDGIEISTPVIRLAPSQSLVLPLQLIQHRPYFEEFLTIKLAIQSHEIGVSRISEKRTLALTAKIALSHKALWSSGKDETAYKASYSLGQMPLYFMVKPPQQKSASSPAIIALHGAGVEASSSFWTDAIKRQPESWIIFPTGRTAWGLDWHGPSTLDVWSSLEALGSILKMREEWHDWSTPEPKVILMGHSNGGQGVWYQAQRFPDRILAAVPAAAYIKSQAYVPLTQTRSGHFMDATLRGILEATLQPDDNDLFLSNLVSVPLMVLHGGDDHNVPTWHGRQLIQGLRTRYPQHDVIYHEVAGAPHWWDTVFTEEKVQNFLDKVNRPERARSLLPKRFILTVAIPEESGSLHGFQIQKLVIPGRLGRLNVVVDDTSITVQTVNVLEYSLDVPTQWQSLRLITDGVNLGIPRRDTTLLGSKQAGEWQVVSSLPPSRRSGPLHSILASGEALFIVIPYDSAIHLSFAARIAHNLLSYLRIAVVVVTDQEALQEMGSGTSGCSNFVIMGGHENDFGRVLMASWPGPITFTKDGWILRGQVFDSAGLGLAFLYRHPTCDMGLSLFMASTDYAGLERILRLFPLRTGVLTPEWIITGPAADTMGAGGLLGAGFWGQHWEWSDVQSWIGFN